MNDINTQSVKYMSYKIKKLYELLNNKEHTMKGKDYIERKIRIYEHTLAVLEKEENKN